MSAIGREPHVYSPFPGMDPYLERPDRWSGVHARLIAVLGEILTRQVAPRFFVDSEDGVYVLSMDDPAVPLVRPDIFVVEAGRAGTPAGTRGRIATPVMLDLTSEVEIRVPYLQILDTSNRQVVTTIEILSTINKIQGSAGRRDFLRKRDQVLQSDTHWLEIDLLRDGVRSPGVPSRGAYAAVLHRAGVSDRLEAWFARLREPLPTIAVPLRAPVADVPLDLQEAVETVYGRYRYDTGIEYGDDPPAPSLSPADNLWLRERIGAWREAQNGQSR
jgi:hypothetical protein